MRASKNFEKWYELLRCIDRGDFKTANNLARKFFGGMGEYRSSKEQKLKGEFLMFLFHTNKIDELNEEFGTSATDKESLSKELKDRFEEETGFFILNRKYLVKSPLTLARYFLSEDEINEYLITERDQSLVYFISRRLGEIHLFNERKPEITYDLRSVKTLSDTELDELIQKHKQRTYIVYKDMLFADPLEFWVAFGFILENDGRKRRADNEYLKKIFDFCEKDSITFIIKDEVDIETIKQSAYKKIDTLRKYNKEFVEFYAKKEQGANSSDITLSMGLRKPIANYYSTAFNFENGEGKHFLAKERFKNTKGDYRT